MYMTAEVIAISVYYRKTHDWEEFSPHTLTQYNLEGSAYKEQKCVHAELLRYY